MGGLGFILYSFGGIIAGYFCHHLKMGYVIETIFKVKKPIALHSHAEIDDSLSNQADINKYDTINFSFCNMFLDLREAIWRVMCCKINGPQLKPYQMKRFERIYRNG